MSGTRPRLVRGLLYVAVAATAWGTGGAVAAALYARSGLGPIAVSFWRFFGGAVALAVAWPVLRGPGSVSPARRFRSAPLQLALTGVGMAVYQTAYFAAVEAAGVAIATVVTLGSGPVLVALGARAWMAERLGRRGAMIVLLALAGLVVLVLGGSSGGTATNPPLGIALALLSAAGYGGTTLLSRTLGTREDRGAGNAPDPPGDALLGFAIGSVCLLPLALATGILPASAGLGLTTAMLAYLGLVPSALAYVLFFSGLTAVPATKAAVTALVEPLAAAVIAMLFLHERLSAVSVSGGVILLVAVIVLALGERRPAIRQAAAAPQSTVDADAADTSARTC